MPILAFIEDQEVIKAILKHLGLWLVRSKPTPKAHAPLLGTGANQGSRDPSWKISLNSP